MDLNDSDDDIETSLYEDPMRHIFNHFGDPYVGNQARYNQNNESNEFKLKVDLPCFNGHLHIEDFLDWLQHVETIFEYMSINVTQQVKHVSYKLRR